MAVWDKNEDLGRLLVEHGAQYKHDLFCSINNGFLKVWQSISSFNFVGRDANMTDPGYDIDTAAGSPQRSLSKMISFYSTATLQPYLL